MDKSIYNFQVTSVYVHLHNAPLYLEKTDIFLSILQIIELKEQKQRFAQGQLANQDGSQGKMPNI